MLTPNNPEEFTIWSTDDTCGLFTSHIEQWYISNQNNLFATLTDSIFYSDLPQLLGRSATTYKQSHRTSLFAFDRRPRLELDRKKYTSFVEKLYRQNVLENPRFPEAPETGWISLNNAFRKIDDIVRTTIVVAYADGPGFIAGQIKEFADAHGLNAAIKDHSKDKGYYAHHVYIHLPMHASSPKNATEYPKIDVPIEIQITTELQGALREITHRLYEHERLTGIQQDWKTQFKSNRFRAAYMAHSLRFIEAMIVELRDGFTEDGQ